LVTVSVLVFSVLVIVQEPVPEGGVPVMGPLQVPLGEPLPV
jgi:hypothetical protein